MELTLAICMYNAEHYIVETLESVIEQTMQDFHLLIVDDCSSDDSIGKVEDFFVSHPRQYEIIRFEKNQGICHARSFAERHATTKYMMFLDSDDLLVNDTIEKLHRSITADTQVMAVSSYMGYIDAKGKTMNGGMFIGSITKEQYFLKASKKKLMFAGIGTMYNRELALRVGGFELEGFPDGFPRWQDYCEDLDLWTRMSDLYKDGYAMITIPEKLYLYRKRGGLSSNSFNMILKMRYTKKNLLIRRNGEQPLSFNEFYSSISQSELKKLKRDGEAADALRNGVFCLRKWEIVKGIGLICHSIALRPGYIVDKIRHNLLQF